MFDSHAHLCFPAFDSDREAVVAASRKRLRGVLVSSAQYAEGRCVLDLVKKHQGFLFASLGFHPTEGNGLKNTIALIRSNADRLTAIGEVGLDRHLEKDEKMVEQQKRIFGTFISLARRLGKPLVIHSWDAEAEAFELVRKAGVEAVFHCFTGKPDLAEEITEKGFYVSISTTVLFSKTVRKTAKRIPLNRLLLETDSPFLDPDRTRKRNTPENILLSAEKIATLRGISPECVEAAALENAKRLFGVRC